MLDVKVFLWVVFCFCFVNLGITMSKRHDVWCVELNIKKNPPGNTWFSLTLFRNLYRQQPQCLQCADTYCNSCYTIHLWRSSLKIIYNSEKMYWFIWNSIFHCIRCIIYFMFQSLICQVSVRGSGLAYFYVFVF
jgi:hypothetical protein